MEGGVPRSNLGRWSGVVALVAAAATLGCQNFSRGAKESSALGLAVEAAKPATALSFEAQAPALSREDFVKHANDPGSLQIKFERRGLARRTQAIVGAVEYEIRAIYTEAIVRSTANLADFHMGVKAQPNSLIGYSLNVPPAGNQVAPGTIGVGVLRYAQHPTLDDPIFPSLVDPTKAINPVTGPGLYFLDRGILRTEHDAGFPPPVRDVFGDVPSRIVPSHSEVDNIKLGMASVEYLLNNLWTGGLTYWIGAASASVPSFTQDRPLTDNSTITMTRYYKWRIPFAAEVADFGKTLPLGRVNFDVRVIGADGQAITFGSQGAILGAGGNVLNVVTYENGQRLANDAEIGLPPYFGPASGGVAVVEAAIIPTPMPTARPGRRYSIVATIAGTGLGGGLQDGSTAAAKFKDPVAGAFGPNGKLYIADFENNLIRVITNPGSTSAVVSTLPGSQGLLKPGGVAVDAAGNVYVGDHEHSAVVKIAPNGQVSTLASGVGKTRGVAVAPDGTVYFASDTGHFIGKISPTGQVTKIAGSTAGNADGIGAFAKFFNPYGIAFDINGNILVADTTNSTIRRLNPATGQVTTIAGTSRGDLVNTNRLDHAAGVVTDKFGNIYIADTGEHKIKILTVDNTTEDLAGTGVAGSQDGPALSATFNLPYGITIDASGDLYVFEVGNDKVRVIK